MVGLFAGVAAGGRRAEPLVGVRISLARGSYWLFSCWTVELGKQDVKGLGGVGMVQPMTVVADGADDDGTGRTGGAPLDRCADIESLSEAVFDDLVELVAERLGTPHAQLSLIGPGQVWLTAATSNRGSSLAPEDTFCAQVAADQRTVVVPDATVSARYANHPAVRSGRRFYAGVPLIAADGTTLGALCAWDVLPHTPGEGDIAALERFGRQAVALLELRRLSLHLSGTDAFLSATGVVLDLIVAGAELGLVLDTLARAVEASTPDTRCSILLLDGVVLHHGAAPSLPASYRDAIDGVRIGPAVGSCGTAAFTGETVIVSDVATDPLWADVSELALSAGLRACWSIPIINAEGKVLGTFALYYGDVRAPTPADLAQVSRWVNLAEVAIRRAGDLAALHEAATVDTLTSLVNRPEALRRLEVATAERGAPLAVLFVDLDQFKFINDTLGHVAGDRFLQEVAARLTACVGPHDTVSRFGGDEFLLLCLDVTAEQTQKLAHRIVAALAQPMSLYGRTVALSASVGIALHPPDIGAESVDLIGDADLAMYAAKRSGRNSVAVFNQDLRQQAAARLSLEGDLSQALINDEMDCAYQPIVDLQTGRLVAVEALLRWNCPTRGQVPPIEFIPTAEDSGHIHALGEFVLRRALTQLAAWRSDNAGWQHLSVAINVSTRQLSDPDFADLVERALRETGVSATHLGLEVTESCLIENADMARVTLTRLRQLGVQVAVDDFGTGYSSLSQLQNLPVDVLKIDQQFITAISDTAGIIQAILTLAHHLHLRVVAEGIETEQQRQELIDLGCLLGQGYLFSRPISAGQITGLLCSHQPPRGIGQTTEPGPVSHSRLHASEGTAAELDENGVRTALGTGERALDNRLRDRRRPGRRPNSGDERAFHRD